MTDAFNRALDLYPEPENWRPTQGIPHNVAEKMTDEQREAHNRAVMLRATLMSDEWSRMVRAFSIVMYLPIPDAPRPMDAETRAEHVRRLSREVNDLDAASTLVSQTDELFDIVYLAIRGLVALGLTDTQILAGFTEVHASNMTKVQDNGMPIINDGRINPNEPIGKILKTNNYVPPDLATAMSIDR